MTTPPTLLIKFNLWLSGHSGSPYQPSGPLFHRWLPDGSNNAIELDTDHPDYKLSVWFERFGYVGEECEHKRIIFDVRRHEVDSNVMTTQAILDGGPLVGLLEVQRWSEDEFNAVTNNAVGDPAYVGMAKRLLKVLLPPVQRFIRVLQIDLGQYWLRLPRAWDSRKESLGSYFQSFSWSIDDGRNWHRFRPDSPLINIAVQLTGESYGDYVTHEDWQRLRQMKFQESKSIALDLWVRSRELYEPSEDLRLSLVEAIAAAEVAVVEALSSNPALKQLMDEALPKIHNKLTAGELFSFLAIITGRSDFSDIALAKKAWDFRNKVVHHGWQPGEGQEGRDVDASLFALWRTTASLLRMDGPRLVSAFKGNAWQSAEGWDRETSKKDQ